MPYDASPIAKEIAARFIGPRYPDDDFRVAWHQEVERLERLVDETLKAPQGEVRGSYPVLLYLGTEADRDELIESAMPHDPETFHRYWKAPFRYCPESSSVLDADNNMAVDVRGYGYLTGKGSLGLSHETACKAQDQLGIHVANLLSLNWPKAGIR